MTMSVPRRFEAWAPEGLPEVVPGDDLSTLIADLVTANGGLEDGDVVVVTSKVVSKAEGRVRQAADREAAIREETVREVASRTSPTGVLRIVENRLGLVMAAAGVDASNTPEGTVLLLPEDPDASARAIRARLRDRCGVNVGVVVSDTAGRPWREGQTDFAIGAAGILPLTDLRGSLDTHGREIVVTRTAVVDEIAAASELVRGKAAARPVAVVRGLAVHVTDDDGPGASALVRPAVEDLFRLGSEEAYEEGYAAGFEEGATEAADADREVDVEQTMADNA